MLTVFLFSKYNRKFQLMALFMDAATLRSICSVSMPFFFNHKCFNYSYFHSFYVSMAGTFNVHKSQLQFLYMRGVDIVFCHIKFQEMSAKFCRNLQNCVLLQNFGKFLFNFIYLYYVIPLNTLN
jgi:hypothetical protein